MALWEEINTQSIDQTFILYVNHDCKQRANCGGSTVKRLSRIRSSKTLLHHIRDGKEDTPNPPITWSELTAVTVAADNCAILKDDRQTPEDTSHTRTVCEKYVIQSTLKQCHSQNEKIFSRYKSAQFFYILISIYTLSFNLAPPIIFLPARHLCTFYQLTGSSLKNYGDTGLFSICFTVENYKSTCQFCLASHQPTVGVLLCVFD